MSNNTWLSDTFIRIDLSATDKVLTVLLTQESSSKLVQEVRDTLLSFGVTEAIKWNISGLLSSARSQSKVTQIKGKWLLTSHGKKYLFSKGISIPKPQPMNILSKTRDDIRLYLNQITNQHTRAFVEEAVKCLEANILRSAVVMSWIGAVAVLHEYIINHHLPSFNTEALRRDSRWKNAVNSDGLSRMKESDFLDVLESLNILGKNVKNELKQCLDRRNSCGHPNSYTIGEQLVAAHIEFLIQNVFSKF